MANSVSPVIQGREPQIFTAGDSLYFSRFLPEFSAEVGYYTQYQLLSIEGEVVIPLGESGLTSTALGNGFLIQVDDFAANLTSGDYKLVGFVFSPANADSIGGTSRQQIYDGPFCLRPNLGGDVTVPNQKTYWFTQMEQLRCTYAQLTQSYVNETDVNRVRVLREKREEIRTELCFAEEKVMNEVREARVKNGFEDPNKIRPVFMIM